MKAHIQFFAKIFFLPPCLQDCELDDTRDNPNPNKPSESSESEEYDSEHGDGSNKSNGTVKSYDVDLDFF